MRNLRGWRASSPSSRAVVKKLPQKDRHTEPKKRRIPCPPLPITPKAPAHAVATIPSEHQSETEFLRHCLRYGNHAGHQALSDRIREIQRDARCVHRAVGLMAVLTVLAAL